ncbi:MAG: PaaI family thioesterase [Tissierellia bacterium]|nr:PaaI family thioesterase [Tissierellia bacterium]
MNRDIDCFIEKMKKPLTMKNIEVIENNKDRVRLKLKVDEEMKNYLGIMHGGMIFTIMDYTAGFMAKTIGKFSVTQNASINYRRPVKNGIIKTDAKIINQYEKNLEILVNLRDDKDLLLAEAIFIMYIMTEDELNKKLRL